MPNSNVRILIVEDDSTIAETMRLALAGRDAEFMLAESLAKARKFLREREDIDIIILDRILPDGDGVELLRTLKINPSMRSIPVLILSGKSRVLDQVEGLNLGADDYMCKPFSVQELRARIDVLIRRTRKFAVSNQ